MKLFKIKTNFDGLPLDIFRIVLQSKSEGDEKGWSGARKRRWAIRKVSGNIDDRIEFGGGVVGRWAEQFDGIVIRALATLAIEVVVFLIEGLPFGDLIFRALSVVLGLVPPSFYDHSEAEFESPDGTKFLMVFQRAVERPLESPTIEKWPSPQSP